MIYRIFRFLRIIFNCLLILVTLNDKADIKNQGAFASHTSYLQRSRVRSWIGPRATRQRRLNPILVEFGSVRIASYRPRCLGFCRSTSGADVRPLINSPAFNLRTTIIGAINDDIPTLQTRAHSSVGTFALIWPAGARATFAWCHRAAFSLPPYQRHTITPFIKKT